MQDLFLVSVNWFCPFISDLALVKKDFLKLKNTQPGEATTFANGIARILPTAVYENFPKIIIHLTF